MKTKQSNISVSQFSDASGASGGFGYWGHELRKPKTDEQLVKAANKLKIPFWTLCSYADSRSARHQMDALHNSYIGAGKVKRSSIKLFKKYLEEWLEEIKTWTEEEVREEKNRFIAQSIQYIIED